MTISLPKPITAKIYYGESNLTRDQVVSIIMNDENLISLLNVMTNVEFTAELDDDLWYVVIWGLEGMDRRVITVLVNDLVGKVVSFNYSNDQISTTEEDIAAARAFFENHLVSSLFSLADFEISTYEGKNEFIIKGVQDDQMFDVFIGYNRSKDGVYSYQPYKVKANFHFGNPVVSFDEASSQVYNIVEIQNYTSSNSNYINETYQVLYYDSPYHTHTSGYSYQYKFSTYGNLALLYENETLSSIANGLPNQYKIESTIWLGDPSINSISIEINGQTGALNQYHSSLQGNYNISQLLGIIFNDISTREWINSLPEFTGRMEYSGNRIFTLYIISHYTDQVGFIKINDTTGIIVDKRLDPTLLPSLSILELLNLVESLPEYNEWKTTVTNHQTFVKFTNGGIWSISYYDPSIDKNILRIQINDSNSQIMTLDVQSVHPIPNLTLSQIMEYVKNSDFELFNIEFPKAKISPYYNNNNVWSLYVYSPIFPGKYLRLSIDDETGETHGISGDSTSPKNKYNLTEVQNYINSNDEFKRFITINPFSEIIEYYYEGTWYVLIESDISLEVLSGIEFQIDDENLNLISTREYMTVRDYVKNNNIFLHLQNGNYEDLTKLSAIRLRDIFGDVSSDNVDDIKNGNTGGVSEKKIYQDPIFIFVISSILLTSTFYLIKYKISKNES
ncbi:MAG: hypothetical protein GPJ54_18585 [Candidatus Heimdallarchaeota archaeon]|nr:hypothetical protein [Candidatus Heimdallarchaeota archaeon]